MKDIIKNKFTLILIFFILFIFALIPFSFGISFVANSKIYELHSDFSNNGYITVIQNTDNSSYITVVYSDSHFYQDGNSLVFADGLSHTAYYYCFTQYNIKKLDTISSIPMSSYDIFNGSTFSFSSGFVPVYASYVLYDKDNNVVFQGAPLEVELMKETQLEEIVPQMVAVVKIVLPVCLAIFGTLLVVYLIKSKNLLHL